MVMKIITTLGIIIILLVTISADVQADREVRGMRGGYDYGFNLDDRTIASLNLTAEQTARIKDLREAYIKEIQPLQNELGNKSGELKQLWLQRSLDQSRISAVDREIRALREQSRAKMTFNRMAIFQILTPEQQIKLQAYEAGHNYNERGGMQGKGGRFRRGY